MALYRDGRDARIAVPIVVKTVIISRIFLPEY